MFDSLVFNKEIDKSILTDGVTLPRQYNRLFGKIGDRLIERGETKIIRFYLNGREYTAKVVNINNSVAARKNDQYQIRYSEGSELVAELRKIFHSSWEYIWPRQAAKAKGDRTRIKVPEGQKEYLAFYATEYEDLFLLEPITVSEINTLSEFAENKDERVFENDFLAKENDAAVSFEFERKQDSNATIEVKNVYAKVRKLDRTIGKELKRLYEYRCQICGQYIGEEYGCEHVVESHHIDYFTRSFNNSSDNQLIVCPNHHSIIHAYDPLFDRKNLMYVYDNGYKESLKLNLHLMK